MLRFLPLTTVQFRNMHKPVEHQANREVGRTVTAEAAQSQKRLNCSRHRVSTIVTGER